MYKTFKSITSSAVAFYTTVKTLDLLHPLPNQGVLRWLTRYSPLYTIHFPSFFVLFGLSFLPLIDKANSRNLAQCKHPTVSYEL